MSTLQSFSSTCISSSSHGSLASGCSFAERPNSNGWLTALTAAAVVGSAGAGGQPQGPPLPPALMQAQGGAQMVAAAAALIPTCRLPRFKNVVSDIRRFAASLYNGGC